MAAGQGTLSRLDATPPAIVMIGASGWRHGGYLAKMSGMVAVVLSAVVPLASALLGLTLTYWINVRTRRTTFVEDLFNSAITAVAVADASQHYMRSVGRPEGMPDRDYRDLLIGISRTAVENHTKRAGEAREALARVLMYEPRVRPYYQDPILMRDRPEEIIQLLADAKPGR